jgi:hypothetical protein
MHACSARTEKTRKNSPKKEERKVKSKKRAKVPNVKVRVTKGHENAERESDDERTKNRGGGLEDTVCQPTSLVYL